MTVKTHVRLILLAMLAVNLSGQYLLPEWFEEAWYWRLPSIAFQLAASLIAFRLTKSLSRQAV